MILTSDDIIPKEHHLLFCSDSKLADEVADRHGVRRKMQPHDSTVINRRSAERL
ncbi:MAG: hypothetical protein DHS20C16_11210 [Phycisphaerae bacterium]|nr:MAG: hypothetical protein DHS20C16_11210 [Phycisphaerae bacterium]